MRTMIRIKKDGVIVVGVGYYKSRPSLIILS